MILCLAETPHRPDGHVVEYKKRLGIAHAKRRELLQLFLRVHQLGQVELAVNRYFLSRRESRGHLRKSYGEPSRQLVRALGRKLKTAGCRMAAKMPKRIT